MSEDEIFPIVWCREWAERPGVRVLESPYARTVGEPYKTTIIDDVLISARGRYAFVKPDVLSPYRAIADVPNYDLFPPDPSLGINLDLENPAVEFIEGDFALLQTAWSHAFYHWHEELSKVVILEDSGFLGSYIVPHSSFVADSLTLMGIAESRVKRLPETAFKVEHLWVPPRITKYDWRVCPDLFFLMRERLAKDVIPAEGSKRLFLLRGAHPSAGRDILNLDQVSDLLQEFSFEPIDFGAMSLQAQISCALSCEFMIGMHGAAFCNSLYMKKGGVIVEFFSPRYINYTFMTHASNLELAYAGIVSQTLTPEYPHGNDALVPINLLRSTLSSMVRLIETRA